MNDSRNKIVELDLNDVLPNRFQPRIKFNEDAIIELSESIKQHGLIQPIIVRPIGDKYEIVAGERRYKACVLAGLATIPAIVVDATDRNSVEIALIENVQRRDLTPIEEAISYNRILDMGYLTQEQLAQKLGKSQSAIANKKRLLNLCDEVQEALMEEKISERHARSLLKLTNADDQRQMLKKVIENRLTVRRLDEEIEKVLAEKDTSDGSEDGGNNVAPAPLDEDSIIDISSLFDDIELNKNTVVGNSNIKKESEEQPAQEELAKSEELESTKKEELVVPIIDIPVPVPDETSSPVIDEVKQPEIIERKEEKTIIEPKQETTSVSVQPAVVSQEIKQIKGEETNMNNNTEVPAIFTTDAGPVISAHSFGKFFDPSYFADEDKPEEPEPDANNSNFAFSAATMDRLLSPQPTEATPSQPSAQPVPQVFETPSNNTMFPDLIQSSHMATKDDVIDQQALDNFLDPTYVDGAKQPEKPLNQGVIDASVFAKFLDPEFDMAAEMKRQEEEKQAQETMPTPAQPVSPTPAPAVASTPVIPAMSFAQYLSSDKPVEEITKDMANQDPNGRIPDLMAPMESSSKMQFNATPLDELATPVDTTLTPDSSIDLKPAPEPEPSIFPTPTPEPVPEETEQPGFVTASHVDANIDMPTTPIMEAAPVVTVPEHDELPEIEIPQVAIDTNIVEPVAPEVSEEVVGPIENQPIIVTDYNKTYDPVLPVDTTVHAPKVDLRDVINMIRELNDKIEGLGFSIDTEEYDLEGIYQVVFKIDKPE